MSPSLKTIPTPPTTIWWVNCLRPLKHCAKSEIMDKKKKEANCRFPPNLLNTSWDVFSWWSSKPEIFFAKRCWRTCSLLFCFLMQIWSICCAYTETQTLPLVLYHAIASPHRGFFMQPSIFRISPSLQHFGAPRAFTRKCDELRAMQCR